MQKISIFLVLLFALCMVLPVSAKVNIGVLGGLNLANTNVDPPMEGIELSNRIFFVVGGVLDYGLSKYFRLRLEAMYLQKGVQFETDEAPGGVDYEFKSAYLEIPVMISYTFVTQKVKPYLIAGPTIGFCLSAKKNISWDSQHREIDIKEGTESIDFGLGLGAGLNVPIGSNSIFLEARYVFGLTNVNEDPSDPEVKNKGIQIFAGITFPLGRK
jgi:hypothetical protein